MKKPNIPIDPIPGSIAGYTYASINAQKATQNQKMIKEQLEFAKAQAKEQYNTYLNPEKEQHRELINELKALKPLGNR